MKQGKKKIEKEGRMEGKKERRKKLIQLLSCMADTSEQVIMSDFMKLSSIIG